MKTKLMAIFVLPLCVVCTSRLTRADEEKPRRLLVVSTTMGFRHSSIPVAENVIRQLADRSGKFTLDFVSVDPNDPIAGDGQRYGSFGNKCHNNPTR